MATNEFGCGELQLEVENEMGKRSGSRFLTFFFFETGSGAHHTGSVSGPKELRCRLDLTNLVLISEHVFQLWGF